MLDRYEDFLDFQDEDERPLDPKQEEAEKYLDKFFKENNKEVFFSRQIEVQNEHIFFCVLTS